MRIPEPGPLGETCFDASLRAMVCGSHVNNPSGGWVESVFTLLTHFLCARAIHSPPLQCRLKNCTARSCCLAVSSVENVPRLRRFPEASFLREYRRYCPDLSLRIMSGVMPGRRLWSPRHSHPETSSRFDRISNREISGGRPIDVAATRPSGAASHPAYEPPWEEKNRNDCGYS